MSYLWRLIISVSLVTHSGIGLAKPLVQHLSAAGSHYQDQDRVVTGLSTGYAIPALRLLKGKGQVTGLDLNASRKSISLAEPNELLENTLGNKTRFTQTRFGLALDQSLSFETSLGFIYSQTTSELERSQTYGFRAYQWLRSNTLRTGFSVSETTRRVPITAYLDSDGYQIRTPDTIEGTTYQVSLLHLTTPTTILQGAISRSTASNRPDADSVEMELRQFIRPLAGALHLGALHYENIGTLGLDTSVGTVVGNTLNGSWHQRLSRRYIVSGGYRYHQETENPRTLYAPDRQMVSHTYHGKLRYRFSRRLITSQVSELSASYGRYTNDQGGEGTFLGVGGLWVLK